MAATREVAVCVLLLLCGHAAGPQPVERMAVSSTELPSNLRNLDDDVATVVDEIVIQEMLDPNKSTLLEMQRLPEKSMEVTRKKNAGIDEKDQVGGPEGDHELSDNSRFALGSEDKYVNNEGEKETIHQIKSLEALEKVITGLRRALGKHLKRRRKKHKSLFKGVRYHKSKESQN